MFGFSSIAQYSELLVSEKVAIPIQYQPFSIVLQYNKAGIVHPCCRYHYCTQICISCPNECLRNVVLIQLAPRQPDRAAVGRYSVSHFFLICFLILVAPLPEASCQNSSHCFKCLFSKAIYTAARLVIMKLCWVLSSSFSRTPCSCMPSTSKATYGSPVLDKRITHYL